jgi:hypothetical protein
VVDLESSLRHLYPQPPATDEGLVDVKRRGGRLRRRRRNATAGVATAGAAVAIAAVVAAIGPFGSHGHQVVKVGGNASTGPTVPLLSPLSARSRATTPRHSHLTPPRSLTPSPVVRPARYVAELPSERIAVVATATGKIERLLTRTPHDVWGTLSADARTFYLSAPTGQESNCPSGSCAIDVVTGRATPLSGFDWGATTPNPLGLSVAPSGKVEADTTPGGATVTVATTTAAPQTYQLPSGSRTNGLIAWSPDGTRLAITVEITAPDGQETGDVAMVNVSKATVEPLISAGPGCQLLSPALTNTELFSAENCKSTAEIARYELVTGAQKPPIRLPTGQTLANSVEPNANGQHLLVETFRPTSDSNLRSGTTLWTVTAQGHWQAIPGKPAAFAWLK